MEQPFRFRQRDQQQPRQLTPEEETEMERQRLKELTKDKKTLVNLLIKGQNLTGWADETMSGEYDNSKDRSCENAIFKDLRATIFQLSSRLLILAQATQEQRDAIFKLKEEEQRLRKAFVEWRKIG
jgi:hypothetical protein